MKKNIFISLLFSFFSLTLLSCKNSNSTKLAYSDNDTIKAAVSDRKKDVSWTKEIEGVLLTENINSKNIELSKKIDITPEVLKVLSVDKNYSIYPEYRNFVKLDTRLLSDVQLKIVQDFCTEFSDNVYSVSDKYFNRKYLFNFIFFRNDLITNWKNNFNEDFPITEKLNEDYKKYKSNKDDLEKQKKEIENQLNPVTNSEDEKTSIKEVTEEQKEELNKKLNKINKKIIKNEQNKIVLNEVFYDYAIGEPFVGQEIIQIPVRFYCKQGLVDVTLYLTENNIYQITINRWETV